MTKAPIVSLLWQIALPAAVGYFFNVMFNVVDSWYAGQISTDAVAGLSLSFPLYFVFLALSMGFGSGATALIGKKLGSGDRLAAAHMCRQVLLFGLLLSVFVGASGLYFSERVFIWLGASGEYLQAASDYMNALYTFAPMILMGPLVNAGLAAQGKTHYLRNVLVVAFFANIILDPWFIYGGFGLPALGVSGLAYSTLLVNVAGLGYLLLQLAKTGFLESVSWPHWKPDFKAIAELLRQGVPSVFAMASIGAFFFIANKFIGQFGTEAVAAYGIGLRIEQLVLVASMAVNHAVLSLVANNLGAGDFSRVRACRRVGLIITSGILVTGAVILLVASTPLMNLFSSDQKVIAIGVGYLAVEAFTLPAYAFIQVNSSVLQGLQRPAAVMWASLARSVICPLILLPLLLNWAGFGITAIWWTIFALTWSVGAALMWYTQQIVESEEKTFRGIDTKD